MCSKEAKNSQGVTQQYPDVVLESLNSPHSVIADPSDFKRTFIECF